jgi:hypothetical protein
MSIARKSTILAATIVTAGLGTVSLASADTTTTAAAPGTATVTLTTPSKTVTLPAAKVTCGVAGEVYGLYTGIDRRGRRVAVSVKIPQYTGAGSYTGSVRVLARGLYGRYAHTFQVPMTLTGTGGSATVSRTLTGNVDPAIAGKTVEMSASWTCTP